MLNNVGTTDRIIRYLIAAVLVLAIVLGVAPGIWAYLAGALALIMVVTATVKFCPLYWPVKISTLGKKTD